MSYTFNGHSPPKLDPEEVTLSWDASRPECSLVFNNASAWPVVFKVKVQESILKLTTVTPAHGKVLGGFSALISLKFELSKMKDLGLDLTHGHRIHIESWYISKEDAVTLDSTQLLSIIKERVENPRPTDTSVFRVRYDCPDNPPRPDRQATLPHAHQTSKQPTVQRSLTVSSAQHESTSPYSTPAIKVTPPTRQQTQASEPSRPHATASSSSQRPSPSEQIARYITPSRESTSHSARRSSNTASRSDARSAPQPIPPRKLTHSTSSKSFAGSFMSARGGSPEDAMDIDLPAVFVEEPAGLHAAGASSTNATRYALPFPEPTAQVGYSWTRPGPSSLHPTPIRQRSPESDWMSYLPVGSNSAGKVKKPQGTPFSGGGFSDVYKCDVVSETSSGLSRRMGAVKVLRPVGLNVNSESERIERMLERMTREAHAWGLINHPNVVPLIGITITPTRSLISPWYDNGNLRTYLLQTPTANRLKLLLDIAKGLAYLHSRQPAVVHGDIKPENILVNDEGTALLMDFGLAMVEEKDAWYSSSHQHGGSVRWMAPELLFNSKETRSCSSDVYSYGGVALEVMTSERPHPDLDEWQIPGKLCDPQTACVPFDRWEVYPTLPEDIRKMIQKCWSRRSVKRPTMKAIEEGLSRFLL